MESLSDTPTESGHLAVALITGAYNITVSLLLAPVQYLGLFIWGLIRWSLSFWLGAFKLLTSPLTTALHIVLFIFSPVEYLVQFMLAPIFAISAIAIKLEVCVLLPHLPPPLYTPTQHPTNLIPATIHLRKPTKPPFFPPSHPPTHQPLTPPIVLHSRNPRHPNRPNNLPTHPPHLVLPNQQQPPPTSQTPPPQIPPNLRIRRRSLLPHRKTNHRQPALLPRLRHRRRKRSPVLHPRQHPASPRSTTARRSRSLRGMAGESRKCPRRRR